MVADLMDLIAKASSGEKKRLSPSKALADRFIKNRIDIAKINFSTCSLPLYE